MFRTSRRLQRTRTQLAFRAAPGARAYGAYRRWREFPPRSASQTTSSGPSQFDDRETGRRGAMQVTSAFEPGTLGHLVHQTLRWPYILAGEFASGSIGEHYRQERKKLAEPVSEGGIDSFAHTETADYWRKQTGMAYAAGKLLSAKQRAWLLKYNARRMGVLGDSDASKDSPQSK